MSTLDTRNFISTQYSISYLIKKFSVQPEATHNYKIDIFLLHYQKCEKQYKRLFCSKCVSNRSIKNIQLHSREIAAALSYVNCIFTPAEIERSVSFCSILLDARTRRRSSDRNTKFYISFCTITKNIHSNKDELLCSTLNATAKLQIILYKNIPKNMNQ